MDSFVNACFVGQPFEKVSDYSTYWYFGENRQATSVRAMQLLCMSRFSNSFPLAVFQLGEPVAFQGSLFSIAVVGTKGIPNTVNRVFRWPLVVNLMFVKDNVLPNWDELDMCDLIYAEIGYLEPTVFEGSPHYDLRVPGQIGEHLYDPNSDGSPGKMVKLPEGDWWLKELTAEE